jgi:hypothetical protein
MSVPGEAKPSKDRRSRRHAIEARPTNLRSVALQWSNEAEE